MPGGTDIAFLIGLLAHLGNHRIIIGRLEEAIDVDIAPALRKSDVLLRSEFLVTQENHAVVDEGLAQFRELLIADAASNIDTGDLGADCRAERRA